MKTALVVPSIRAESFKKFINAWSAECFDTFIIVEDNPTKEIPTVSNNHYCWKDIDDYMGDDKWIISRRDSAIRCFGFLKAYEGGADIIFTLDDDCYPVEKYFIETHISQLKATPKWTELIPGMRTRGIPYFNKGSLKSVVANIGLWTKNPDLDAIQMLTNPIKDFFPITPNRVMPHGQYFPFTGMNFSFIREVAVMTYFPLMGVGEPYGRFDDIWFGIIFKKICDHLNYSITCGQPYVEHIKASNAMTNLVKEAPGIKANEHFWEAIDDIILLEESPKGCMKEIGSSLSVYKDPYLSKLGKAISIWTKYF